MQLPKTGAGAVVAIGLVGVLVFLGWTNVEEYIKRQSVRDRVITELERTDEFLYQQYRQLSETCDAIPPRCMEVNSIIFNLRHDMQSLCNKRPKYCPGVEAILSKAQQLSPWVGYQRKAGHYGLPEIAEISALQGGRLKPLPYRLSRLKLIPAGLLETVGHIANPNRSFC